MRVAIAAGDDLAGLVRGGEAVSIVLVVAPIADPLALAMTRAAIGPLAIERAPGVRVNAVFVSDGAAEADVEAAALFLDTARSTTGQILDIR